MLTAASFRYRLVGVALSAACLVFGGCGSGAGGTGRKPLVVATTTQIGDLVRAVGGDRVAVHQILAANTDPHEYEPRPDDVRATTGARVVLVNGDNLDSWISKIVAQAGRHPRVVDLGTVVPVRLPGESSGKGASRVDPHWWHDPRNVVVAVERIRAELARADPSGAQQFARNASAYLAKLRTLDRGIARCIATVPAARRKLVTSHDAFAYLAHRYGLTVVGAIIPSQTTQAAPSAGDIAALVKQLRRERVSAIFLESSINPKLTRAVARETGALGNLTLYGDTLGSAGSRGATYLAMEAA
ncbi:MAG TPA: metal ABC transporter substrate-binding protein, partial [Solirubrobacteraceae bacterium]|nr:metal ABC transporter substrate-binding protein [Solirubrobacteraceae bacterium]